MAQDRHRDVPDAWLYVPGVHGVHDDWPMSNCALPISQDTQDVRPVVLA